MGVTIFWCEWDEKQMNSHELLRQAAEQYLGQEPLTLVEERYSKEDHSKAGGKEKFRQENGIRIHLAKTEKGKPYFADFPQVKFSISHSGNFWACAFGDEEVGLDLQSEYMKNGEKIARRFFHPEEIAWMEENGFDFFSRLWTYKESYVKFTGMGLSGGMDYFSVVPQLVRGDRAYSFAKETPDGGLRDRGNRLTLAGACACDGDFPVCQQEIPFREGFWLVLTSGEPQEIGVRELLL